MAIESVLIKNHIKDYLEGLTDPGDDLDGMNIYDASDMPYRQFYPCITVDTPRITLLRRLVGGPRIFQLNMSFMVYITERDGVTISGTEYTRDDLNKIYAERLERALENIGLPDNVTVYGVPDTGSIQLPAMDGNYRIYQSAVEFMMAYIESD